MKKHLIYACLSFLVMGTIIAVAEERPDIVRAKIGLQLRSGDQERWAKTQERVKSDDSYRIYVMPEADAYIYVLYMNNGTVELLGERQYIDISSSELPVGIWPSLEDLYQFDATNTQEDIITICSPVEIPDVEHMLTSQEVLSEKWAPIEQQLVDQSTIDLSSRVEKPWDIAATVRGQNMEFYTWLYDELPTYSGKSLVIKHYEFRVKK